MRDHPIQFELEILILSSWLVGRKWIF